MGKIPQYVPVAKKMGMPAISIMDHGSLAGAYEFYSECRKNEIEPVIGMEAYYVPNITLAREFKDAERFHVGILARGERGYRVLKELNDAAQANFYYKPLLDRNILEGLGADAKHLVCLSGCAGSILSRSIMGAVDIVDYEEELEWWRSIFTHFFMEHQWHNIEGLDRKLNIRLKKSGRQNEIPHVITNDCHYCLEGDSSNHDALLCIQTQSKMDDPNRFKFDGGGYHLASSKEIHSRFATQGFSKQWIDRGLRNSNIIAKNCRTRIPAWESRTWHIPPFPGVRDPQKYLTNLVLRGLSETRLSENPTYVSRAKHELAKFKQVGVANFLLIAQEQVLWAKAQGIPTGPGRGSVAGSLVAYLIGITEVDSIKYKLRFERFLNPERPKMPDVDFDFSPSGRELVKAHSAELYGAENVIPVGAFQTMKVAGTFRKLASAHGIEWSEINRLSKLLNPIAEEGEEEEDEAVAVIPKELREAYPELAEEVAGLVGTRSAISSHASGIMIFDPNDPIKDLIPKMWLARQKKLASAFDLVVEKIGLLKMDDLGLRTLDTIDVCLKILRDQYDIEVDPTKWVPDDEEDDADVYAMLAKGKTAGVFQFEGKALSRGIKEVGCERFEDMATTTAIYRLGPIMAGADKRLVRNKNEGIVRVTHPLLTPILEATYGEMAYQEQMMDICHDIAGLSWIDTDDIKEIVRFKDPARMSAYSSKFIEGCKTTSDIDRETATNIWKMIEAQSAYLYNRSHSISYSLISYRTARLKYLYPLQYLTAYLATVKPDSESHKRNRKNVLSECHERGFKILPPEINHSGVHMTCRDQRTMQFGFADIKGIGEASANKLMNDRIDRGRFYNLEEVVKATGKRTREALAGCGALRWIGGPKPKRSQIEEYIDWIFDDPMGEWRSQLENHISFPTEDKDWAQVAGVLVEKAQKTTKGGKPYNVWVVRWSPSQSFTCQLWSETETYWKTTIGSIVAIEGEWSEKYANISVGDSGQIKILRRISAN